MAVGEFDYFRRGEPIQGLDSSLASTTEFDYFRRGEPPLTLLVPLGEPPEPPAGATWQIGSVGL